MPDMLVRLYDLPDALDLIRSLAKNGVNIRRSISPEKHIVVDFVKNRWGQRWANQVETAYSNTPVSCWMAVKENALLGFAVYDATCRNFFGPTGVEENARGNGIGKTLLLLTLHDMAAQGYAYAIIGGAGPTDFYTKTVKAILIPDSSPGIYKGVLTSSQ